MANNKVNNQNRSLIDQQRAESTGLYNSALGGIKTGLDNATNQDQQLRSNLQTTYSNPSTFMPSGMLPNSSGFFNLPTGVSSKPAMAGADFGNAQSGYQGMADTGGASNFAGGQKAYQSLADTGGIGDPNSIIRSMTANVPSFYQALRDQMAQRSNVQGGYTPGYDAQTAKMARDESAQAEQANINANASLQGMIQQGKEAGAAGLTGIGSNITGNQLAGLGGLFNIGNANLGASEFNAGQSNAMNAQNLQFQQNMADLYNRSQLAGAQGLSNLYTSTPGATSMYNQLQLSGLGGLTGSQQNNLGLRASVPNNSILNYIPGMVGATGSLLTGIGGLG